MFGWFKKKINEVKTSKYEFITNPLAKEMAEKNALEYQERLKKERIEAEIRKKRQFIGDIEKLEKYLDVEIRKHIQYGIKYTNISVGQLIYDTNLTQLYIAARRFRKRGFKVKILSRDDFMHHFKILSRDDFIHHYSLNYNENLPPIKIKVKYIRISWE